jgi:hypothetical protein
MTEIHVIQPDAVYTVQSAQAVLGLKKTTIGREVRLRRLRVSKRGGRYFILGSWLLEWLREGEVGRPRNEELKRGVEVETPIADFRPAVGMSARLKRGTASPNREKEV